MSLPKIDRNVGAPDFEDVVAEAQASNDFKPLWNRMVKTRFFVAVNRFVNDGKSDFRLAFDRSKSAGTVAISEYKDKLECPAGAELVFLTGAQIVRRTPEATTVRMVLASRNLDMTPPRVDWVKKSLEASRQALLRKQEANKPSPDLKAAVMKTGDTLPPINAISMPLPDHEQQQGGGWDFRVSTLRADTNVPGAHAQVLAATPAFNYQSLELEPTKPSVSQDPALPSFDASAIRRRHVNHAGLGIELFVPMTWEDVRNDKALKLLEKDRGIVIECNGRRRDDMSFSSWMEMRIPLVMQEMPFLRKISELREFRGRDWKEKISAQVVEFRGEFLGDGEESIYQFYCIQTPKNFVSVGVKAKVSQIDQLRPLLEWVVAGIEVYETFGGSGNNSADVNPYAAGSVIKHRVAEVDAPSPFSISMKGRIGRLRFVAYSLVAVIPLLIAAFAVGLKVAPDVGMAAGLIIFTILFIRPMALRMHDWGLSAWWILLAAVLAGPLAVAIGVNPEKFGNLLGMGMYLMFLLIPGNADENKYGPPCPPNSTAVVVIATITIVLNLIGQVVGYKMQNGGSFFGSRTSETKESGFGFSPPDQSYTINFPRKPTLNPEVAAQPKAKGIVSMRMYQSTLRKKEYMVQEVELEIIPPDRSAALTAFSDYMGRNLGEMLSSERTTVSGYPGQALTVKTKSGSIQHLRFLIVSNRIYVLGVQAPTEKEAAEEDDSFFGTFQVNHQ